MSSHGAKEDDANSWDEEGESCGTDGPWYDLEIIMGIPSGYLT
jgi:hypothetical protein